jgi:hypothetical protein
VRVVGRWALRAGNGAVADVRKSDIIPVRAIGARSQLRLNKSHYIAWWYSSCSDSQFLVFLLALNKIAAMVYVASLEK